MFTTHTCILGLFHLTYFSFIQEIKALIFGCGVGAPLVDRNISNDVKQKNVGHILITYIKVVNIIKYREGKKYKLINHYEDNDRCMFK